MFHVVSVSAVSVISTKGMSNEKNAQSSPTYPAKILLVLKRLVDHFVTFMCLLHGMLMVKFKPQSI